ncbi:MAG: hypothetical protein J5J06_07455 [Phycisphaerae bacterium]|nr:hypothetical protein [Phycisphaerae bacterium]
MSSGIEVRAQTAVPVFSLEVAAINGQVLRNIPCASDAECPGNGTCQMVTGEGLRCTKATSLVQSNGDISPGDTIKVDAFVRNWDANVAVGVCENDSACTTIPNSCTAKHCSGNRSFQCTTDSSCASSGFGVCIPDVCRPYPLLGLVQFHIDGATYAATGAGSFGRFNLAEIPCTPATCNYFSPPVNNCACAPGYRFIGSCTCAQLGICNPLTNLCRTDAIVFIENTRTDFLMAGLTAVVSTAVLGQAAEVVLVATYLSGAIDTTPSQPRYMGSTLLTAEPLMKGLVNIIMDNDPLLTFATDQFAHPLPGPNLEGILILFDLNPPCDDGNDCTVDVELPDGSCEYEFRTAGTPCGNQVPEGPCDNADICDGAGSCINNYEPATTACRPAISPCDVAEFCTSVEPDCPPDIIEPADTLCRPVAGPCDVEEMCDGVSPECPTDEFLPELDGVGTPNVCRLSAGSCDPEEHCTGTSAECPTDLLDPSIAECRPAAGLCDTPEYCTGADPECPVDSFEPGGTVCRSAVNACDLNELCTGVDPSCPPDLLAPNGTSCPDDTNECTRDICDGSGTCTHPDNHLCGACCLPDKDCLEPLLGQTCASLGGTFNGALSACLGDTDADGVDDMCDNCPGVDDNVFGTEVCSSTGAHCDSDADCGMGDTCVKACIGKIPTVSAWGTAALALTLLVAGKLSFRRRPISATA